MKATGLVIVVAAALSLAGLSVAMAGASTSGGTTVSTAKTGLGMVVANARGRTLYLFEKDSRRHSACSGACAAFWPPLIAHGRPMARGGAKQALLGTIKRSNGTRQVTYAGHPLYLYVQDTKRGKTTGEGSTLFGAGWDALTPAGKKIERDGS
jgi:predicted lipoprotein with Yx(FWY)xxD motif